MARNKLIIAAAAVAVAAATAVTVWLLARPTDAAEARTMTVNGNVTLTTTDVYYWSGQLGEECYGTGPFKDLVEGAPVAVYDTTGNILGRGELKRGSWYDSCLFKFSVHQVRETPTVEVEVSGRGRVAFDLEQVKNGGVRLSIGP